MEEPDRPADHPRPIGDQDHQTPSGPLKNRSGGSRLSDEGVHVLDPFTGTGTFIAQLLQSGLIRPQDTLRKYTQELHANEMLLLAYYIAAINIEATFHGLHGGEYVPFSGIVLADTFQIAEDGDTMDEDMFPQNNARVVAQNALDIRVIVGNPPYSSGQTSQNDSNQNQKYPTLDSSIAATYAARSTATLKNSLYDSYIRAIRWASDRIGASKQGGVIGFVTNGGFIDGNTADGLRKTLVGEFDTIYCFNLRGNARTGGDLRQREAGNVFGSGSRSTVAITLLVRKPGSIPRGRVLYRDIGDYLSGDAKLEIISTADVATATWSLILPSADGDWINQRSGVFNQYLALGDKNGGEVALFNTYSGGLKSNRDAWVYNSASRVVRSNVGRMIDFYNRQVSEFSAVAEASKISDPAALVDTVVDLDPAKFSWDRADRARLVRGVRYSAWIHRVGF